jgi:hypothetical protein
MSGKWESKKSRSSRTKLNYPVCPAVPAYRRQAQAVTKQALGKQRGSEICLKQNLD